MIRIGLAVWLALGVFASSGAVSAADAQTVIESKTPLRNRDVVFVPTRETVATAMMQLAGVTKDDVVYDLGCGDGRIVIAAARSFGARGVGIDLDPDLIGTARDAAARAGVSDLVEFRVGNVLEADVSKASVVALYLLAASNVRLRPQLVRQLSPGARIVAHNFGMGDWEPDAVDTFRDAAGTARTLYLWRIDGRVKP
jgi:trans-aconitate methyltransferase